MSRKPPGRRSASAEKSDDRTSSACTTFPASTTSVPVSFIEYNTWRQCLSGTDDPNTSRGLRFVRMLKPLKLFKIFRILKLGKVTTVRLAHLTRLMSAQNSNVIATVTATRVSVTTPGLPRTLAAHRVPPAVGGLCSP